MVLDNEQRQAVEVRHNVVVSAGAGSGKTRVLAERYMQLLRNGEATVPEILALTFTRKAAAEMFGRIYTFLNDEAGTAPTLQRELARFDEARISTIDSFCLGILRDGLASFGLPSRVESDDRRFVREADRLALSFLLDHHDDPILAKFIRQYGVRGTTDELLIPLITGHVHLSRGGSFLDDFHRQQRWLERRKAHLEEKIQEVLNGIAGLEPGSPSGVAALQGCLDRRADLEALHDFMAGLRKTFGKKGDSETLKEMLNTLFDKAGGGRPSGYLVEWEQIRRTWMQSAEREHLFGLLDTLRHQALKERRSSGLLGHQEVMELSVRLLQEDGDLRRMYAGQYRYIMIDEFQDNNQTQRDLLFLLADAGVSEGSDEVTDIDTGKLFFVGDQKQSIYRFRGADVAVFRNLEGEIARSLAGGAREQARIHLSTNYRSSRRLIDFFNALFPSVFGEAAEDYEAEFAPLRAGADEESPGSIPSGRNGVTVAWVAGEDKERGADGERDAAEYARDELAEGAWIADEIARLVAEDGYAYGDVAILLRSSAGQQAYERMLRRRGVPYQTQAVRSLFTEAPAHDLYALLQLHFHPADDEALVSYLRSPLVMLSDAALVRVLNLRRAGDENGPVGLFTAPAELEAEDREKLKRAEELYNQVGAQLDREPLHDVVRTIWDEGGYRYAVLHRASDHSYLEHYDYLFALALQFSDRPAVEFVDFLREQMGGTDKLDELESGQKENVVQLMTVHKSKGLEFPVVFVADCDRQLLPRSELIWDDPELGVTIRLPSDTPGETTVNVIEAHARTEELLRSEAELKRLLYVAATRAEERLYFSAAIRKSDRGASFFRLLRDAMQLDVDARTTGASCANMVSIIAIPPVTEDELRRAAIPQGARRRRRDARSLLHDASVTTRTARRIEYTPTFLNDFFDRSAEDGISRNAESTRLGTVEGGQGELFPADEELHAATLGTLTHRLLERTAVAGGDVEAEGWTPVHPDVIPVVGHIDSRDERERLCRESRRMARDFLASPLFQQVTSGDVIAVHREMPFILNWEDERSFLLRGTMDLVAEGREEVHVIDYKTDMEVNPDRYRPQLAVYRRAAQEIFGKPVTTTLYYLRHGRSVQLSEELDDYLVDLEQLLSDGR